MALLEAMKCSNATDTTPSNAGVAGTGVLLSFMITAVVAVLLSTSVILADVRGNPSVIRKRLLSGYSDSQILQGIGIQCVGLAKVDVLVPYHFFLVWMQSLLSMVTHNITLLALAHDYRQDWVLRWIRQSLMLVNLILSSISGILVLQAVSKGLDNKTLPIACAWKTEGNESRSSAGVSWAATISIIVGNCAIFVSATWYLHSRNRRFYRAVQCAGLIVMTAVAVGAGIRICLLSQAFGSPSVTLSDDGEMQWSFGQLLSILVLLYPLLSVVEIYREKIKSNSRIEDDNARTFVNELQPSSRRHS